MSKSNGTLNVNQSEFYSIRRELKNGAFQKDVAEHYKRGQSTISRIATAKSWKAYSSLAARPKTKKAHILDANLTKKQAQAFLDMQTQLEIARGQIRRLESYLETKNMDIAEQKAIIESYEAQQSTPVKRSFLSAFKRGN